MSQERRTAAYVLLVLFLFSLGLSLTINLKSLQGNFLFADEAIYFSLTQSLAQDFDLEYTKKDLYRYFRDMESEPLGIFLKRGRDGKIFFGKSFAYPLFAAPFVRVFGINGFLVFHAVLLGLMLWMGSAYLSRTNDPFLSTGGILTFLFATVAAVYFLWISPDFFNLFLAFSVIFLWLYKHGKRRDEPEGSRRARLESFLLSDGSDYLAAALAGIAFFAKPPNIALMGPLVLHSLIRKRFGKAALVALLFVLVSGIFWGTNYLETGDWNYQGGERKTFYGSYPFEREGVTFDSVGREMTSENYGDEFLLPAKFVAYNLFYYFFGRFTGIHWYFFPAFLGLILFLKRRKNLEQWLLFTALAGEILIYVVLMPDNYAGGAALGNRYFLSIYPLFFFLPGARRKPRELAACWIVASLFIAQILVSPIRHSHYPATHAKKFPFNKLPVELTLTNNFPTNTNPQAFRQQIGTRFDVDVGWLHFLDDNFHPRQEPDGFWTKGSGTAEIVLKTWFPVQKLVFRLLNNPRMSNTVTVKVWGEKKSVTLGKNQWGVLEFTPKRVFRMEGNHLYRFTVKADKGSIPFYEEPDNLERRHLGVFFSLEIIRKN